MKRFVLLIAFAALAARVEAQEAARRDPLPKVGTASAAADNVKVESVWDFVVKGGPVMIPIGICSLIALTVIAERLVCLRKRQIIPPGFFSGLGDILNGGGDRNKAMEFCKKHPSPASEIVVAGIKRLGEPRAVLEKSIQDAGEREIIKLRKYLRILSVTASVAPLLGLLGTIFGMITAFQTVAASGEALGRTELLAKGIYEAMITTAAGLMVAIPALIAYHALSAKVDGLVHEMDRRIVDLLETISIADQPVPRRAAAASSSSAIERDGDGRVPDAAILATVSSCP
jgi:biopolymer transport protein ExbB